VERALTLLENGAAPERVLLLTPGRVAATSLARRLHDRIGNGVAEQTAAAERLRRCGYGEPPVLSAAAFCAGLLRGEALHANLDPFFVSATRADRLAALLAVTPEPARRSAREQGAPGVSLPRNPAAALRVLKRIDRLKGALVDAGTYAEATALVADDDASVAARAFAAVYSEHEQMLAEHAALDAGDLLLRAAALLRELPAARERLGRHLQHLLVDDLDDGSPAFLALVELLTAVVGDVTLAGDDHALIGFARTHPNVRALSLQESLRCAPRLLHAARAIRGDARGGSAISTPGDDAGRGQVSFWRCVDEREQAEVVVTEIERLLDAGARSIGIVVRSLRRDGRSLVGALKNRAVPYCVAPASELFEHAEVRDLLAWLRLLADPCDRNAAIRLLTRSPVELRPVDLARVVQVARRRKLDMPSALAVALDVPQVPPEARERVADFAGCYTELASAFEELGPAELVHKLIERAGLRGARLLAGSEHELEGLLGLARVEELARHFVSFAPPGSARDFAAYLGAAADAGLSFEELLPDPDEALAHDDDRGAVHVLNADAVRGHEFDHLFVCGLGIPASADESAEPGGLDADVELLAKLPAERQLPLLWLRRGGALRRSLYRAITRSRERAVLVYTARDADRAAQRPLAAVEDARHALREGWEDRSPAPRASGDELHAIVRVLRGRVLEDAARIGGRLGELRLDTGEDVSHGVARYLQLLKLAALLGRPAEQSVADALPELNARLVSACTPRERELFESSRLDDALLSMSAAGNAPAASRSSAAAHATLARALDAVGGAPEDSRLAAFLPRRGDGLVLSASDVGAYRACPLRYKYARVLRIPAEPTPQQRFGIMVHKVLERYHSEWDSVPADVESARATLMRLLDAAWRRAGFRDSPSELALLERARGALIRYHRQLTDQPGRPVWFERSFSFAVGAHWVRGRVDRVDRIADGAYELIDYKTGHARTPSQLEGDVQLSLYALAARRAWNITAARQAYYYVLDNRKVSLPDEQDAGALRRVTDTIEAVADGIRALKFAPTPSYAVCSGCDFLAICPAAEA
jgi:DNA helicase-2/ATP-dependent DNA helicase PcrA